MLYADAGYYYGARDGGDALFVGGSGRDGLRRAMEAAGECGHALLVRAAAPEVFRRRRGVVLAAALGRGVFGLGEDGRLWLTRATTSGERGLLGAYAPTLDWLDPAQAAPCYAVRDADGGDGAGWPGPVGIARATLAACQRGVGFLVRLIVGQAPVVLGMLNAAGYWFTAQVTEGERGIATCALRGLAMARAVPDFPNLSGAAFKDLIHERAEEILRIADAREQARFAARTMAIGVCGCGGCNR